MSQHSYQDLDVRVSGLESKIDFMMKSVRTKAIKPGKGLLVGPDGRPTVAPEDIIDLSLLDVYNELVQGNIKEIHTVGVAAAEPHTEPPTEQPHTELVKE